MTSLSSFADFPSPRTEIYNRTEPDKNESFARFDKKSALSDEHITYQFFASIYEIVSGLVKVRFGCSVEGNTWSILWKEFEPRRVFVPTQSLKNS